ncbi:MAD2 mitotic arrest deficient-like 2 [Chytridiales sp. JEL 0842]|nr:MAD2 mitotic arrest deficient-like 2 [Chytridiales sp. JEL 0842]
MLNTLDVILEFLEVAIHSILYYRKVYPEDVFIRARKYQLIVRKSRHPLLNEYILDFLDGIKPDLLKGVLNKVHVVILDSLSNPVEKFVFQVRDAMESLTFESKKTAITSASVEAVESYFRNLMMRIMNCGTYLQDNEAPAKDDSNGKEGKRGDETEDDANLTFNLFCELYGSEPHPTSYLEGTEWVMAEASLVHLTRSSVVPLKTLDAGVVQVQMYMEEGEKA